MLTLFLLHFFSGSATAGPVDGHYQVAAMLDIHGARTAEDLGVEGCWSREIWAFREDHLLRGHQQLCTRGKVQDACEAWVTVPVTYGEGVVIPYDVSSTGKHRTIRLVEEERAGSTSRNRTEHADACKVHLAAGNYLIAVRNPENSPTLVLSDPGRQIEWHLTEARPAEAPFTEVRR